VKPNPSWSFKFNNCQEWAYWDDLFTAEECKKIIALAEKDGFEDGVVRDGDLDLSERRSKINWLAPSDETVWIYEKITNAVLTLNSKYFNFDLFGFTEAFQVTKYTAPDGCYDAHVDTVANGIIRKLTAVVQLTHPDEYEGGGLELVYSKNPTPMEKTLGRLVLFPSYVLHRVVPVSSGTRYSMVCWATGAPFK